MSSQLDPHLVHRVRAMVEVPGSIRLLRREALTGSAMVHTDSFMKAASWDVQYAR